MIDDMPYRVIRLQPLIAQQSLYNMIHPQMSQIGVGLTTPDKQDRLARHVGHGQRRADLVVLRSEGTHSAMPVKRPRREATHNRVKLGQDDTVDAPLAVRSAGAGKVLERPVELGQLVDSLVADQGLPDEDDLVRIVDRYKLGSAAVSFGVVIIGHRPDTYLGQSSHERLVVLHSPRRVDQHHVKVVLLG